MNYKNWKFLIVSAFVLLSAGACGQDRSLRLIFIRHGEKAKDDDNLNCQGFNRSVMLPNVLIARFGKPDEVYLPSIQAGNPTKHLRMLQTITPMAVKYHLQLNSNFDVGDYTGTARSLLKELGMVLIVWEHQGIPKILKKLGIKEPINWPPDDFNSIWIVTFKNGKAKLTRDSEMLNPADVV
jgi:hypothetical protein